MRTGHWLIITIFLSISFGLITKSHGRLDESLAAAWLFEDGIADGLVSDLSGNGNDCEIIGDGVSIVDGKFGSAINISGEDGVDEDYLSCGAGESISGLKNFTLMFWFHTEFPDSTQPILMKGVGGGEWGFNYSGRSNGFWNEISFDGTRMDLQRATTLIAGFTWYHGAFSFDGTTRRLYTNGALDNEVGVLLNEAPAEGEISATANPLLIGGWAHPAGNRFASKGSIDEAAVFNVALSQADIENIMNNGLMGSGAVAVEPIGKLATTWGKIRKR